MSPPLPTEIMSTTKQALAQFQVLSHDEQIDVYVDNLLGNHHGDRKKTFLMFRGARRSPGHYDRVLETVCDLTHDAWAYAKKNLQCKEYPLLRVAIDKYGPDEQYREWPEDVLKAFLRSIFVNYFTYISPVEDPKTAVESVLGPYERSPAFGSWFEKYFWSRV